MAGNLNSDCPACGGTGTLVYDCPGAPEGSQYSRKTIPTKIAVAISGQTCQCSECGVYYKIYFTLPVVPKSMIMKSTKKAYDRWYKEHGNKKL